MTWLAPAPTHYLPHQLQTEYAMVCQPLNYQNVNQHMASSSQSDPIAAAYAPQRCSDLGTPVAHGDAGRVTAWYPPESPFICTLPPPPDRCCHSPLLPTPPPLLLLRPPPPLPARTRPALADAAARGTKRPSSGRCACSLRSSTSILTGAHCALLQGGNTQLLAVLSAS